MKIFIRTGGVSGLYVTDFLLCSLYSNIELYDEEKNVDLDDIKLGGPEKIGL
jgi:hypothetical protein